MSKIVFVVPSLKSKGPTRQLIYLMETLGSDGHQVHLYVIGKIEEYWASALPPGCVLVDKLKSGYDHVISQGFLAELFAKFRFGFRKPKIILRNVIWADYRPKFGIGRGFIISLLHWISILTTPRNNRIFCSNSVEVYFSKKHIRGRTLKNFLGETQLRTLHKINNDLNASNILTFGFVGSINPRKGLKNYIQFMDLLKSKGYPVRGVVYGVEASERPDVDYVIYKGFSNNISEIYASFDILVSLSSSEGYPNTVLEALAAGKICILSDIDAHLEIKSDFQSIYILDNWDNIPELSGKSEEIFQDILRLKTQEKITRRDNYAILEQRILQVKGFFDDLVN